MGAGGTSGGAGRFFLGLVMMVAGGYLFLDAVNVTSGFGWGRSFLHVGGVGVSGGMTLVPFLFGVGWIFYNAEAVWGWLLAGASLVMLVAGVIASIQMHLRSMSAFELLMILGLLCGGIGLFLSSLKPRESRF